MKKKFVEEIVETIEGNTEFHYLNPIITEIHTAIGDLEDYINILKNPRTGTGIRELIKKQYPKYQELSESVEDYYKERSNKDKSDKVLMNFFNSIQAYKIQIKELGDLLN